MTSKLTCRSFHSVKGGVGKSTLAVAHALSLAQKHAESGRRVYLLDLDLTGTSLADVLPLCAPRWEGVDPLTLGHSVRAPTTAFTRTPRPRSAFDSATNSSMSSPTTAQRMWPSSTIFLLFQSPDREGGIDMALDAMCWRMEGAPDNLRVIPSSALPRDLDVFSR